MIKETIECLIRADTAAMQQLELVRELCPADAFIAAGFVRNRVWDALYDPAPVAPVADVDVVYFCRADMSPERDYQYEALLSKTDAATDWQVRNQARMHEFGGYDPFSSLDDALMHWAETATSVGVRLDAKGAFHFVAPYGFDDLENHILRITDPMRVNHREAFTVRVKEKGWPTRWPKLQLEI